MLSRSENRNPSLVTSLMLLAILFVCQTGCTTLNTLGKKEVPTDSQPADPAGTFIVEMRGVMSKPKVYEGMLDGPVTVQAVLEEFGATKKYKNMEITVLRIVEETGRGLKLPVKYNVRKKSVSPEQDYAILPKDRIVIEPSSGSTLAKMVNSMSSN